MRSGLPPESHAWAESMEKRLRSVERAQSTRRLSRLSGVESLRGQKATVRLHTASFEINNDSTELGVVDLNPPPGFRETHLVGCLIRPTLDQPLNILTIIDVVLTTPPTTEFAGAFQVASLAYHGGELAWKITRHVSFSEDEDATLRALTYVNNAPPDLSLQVDFKLAVAWLP